MDNQVNILSAMLGRWWEDGIIDPIKELEELKQNNAFSEEEKKIL